ncbi:MAG TPA: hypothetical protein VHG10_13000 [Glycomyces sp.]|nr:hypothetical protein [Glycomyces sp.]
MAIDALTCRGSGSGHRGRRSNRKGFRTLSAPRAPASLPETRNGASPHVRPTPRHHRPARLGRRPHRRRGRARRGPAAIGYPEFTGGDAVPRGSNSSGYTIDIGDGDFSEVPADAVRGCAAVERGPVVLCAESWDMPDGAGVSDLTVDTQVPPVERDGCVHVAARLHDRGDAWPYGSPPDDDAATAEVALVPFHLRATRGPAQLRGWMPLG